MTLGGEDEILPEAMKALLRLGDLAVPMAVRTASLLGIADRLGDRQWCVESLAASMELKPQPLERLLGVLSWAGLVERSETGEVKLAEAGQVLRTDHRLSMRDAFSLAATEIGAWTHLEHCVRTGRSGFERLYGESHRTYRAKHIEEDVRMDRVHQAATRLDLLTLSRAYPWQNARTLVDVGGGTGTFLAGLLCRFPDLRAVLFDLPRMLVHAPVVLERSGVADRCSVVGGDFFDEVPPGADLYVLKAVVGGWDDAACVRIFSTVRRAMRADSRLLLIEPVMGEGAAFDRANVAQLQLLVLYGGTFRAVDAYRPLAAAAELELVRVVPRSTLSILELLPCGHSSSAGSQ